MTPASSMRGQAQHRYFTEEDARLLIGRRVQVRVAPGYQGTVAYFASGPEAGEYILGVRWDDPRPVIASSVRQAGDPSGPAGYSPAHVRAPAPGFPRSAPYPLDWYTVEEYHRLLLSVPVEGEYPSASEAGRPQGDVRHDSSAAAQGVVNGEGGDAMKTGAGGR